MVEQQFEQHLAETLYSNLNSNSFNDTDVSNTDVFPPTQEHVQYVTRLHICNVMAKNPHFHLSMLGLKYNCYRARSSVTEFGLITHC